MSTHSLFSYLFIFSVQNIDLGYFLNHFMEVVLISTHNQCFRQI